MNPIACSRAFDYVRKEEGNKAVIVLLDDLHEAANGSENIAKVITMYASESCTDIVKHLDIQILPESYIEYVEKYINEIEENIKELKKNKVKAKKEYTFNQGSIEGYPNLKKILEKKAISELVYR